MIISIIVAVERDGGIGFENTIPWMGSLPRDMKHFKDRTTGHSIIMGRFTFHSIGRALPNRRTIVLSRTPGLDFPGAETFASLSDALKDCRGRGEKEVFICGGGQVYAEALPVADRIYLTRINHEFTVDTVFPQIDRSQWKFVSEEPHDADEKNLYPISFETYVRRTA